MNQPLRIGILGAARITPKALIHPARVIPAVRLEAVAARDRARAEALAAEFGIARVCDAYAAVIADPEVDLVYNPLPIDAHAKWTIAALEAGKHVLCEKPLAMHSGEVRDMLAAAEASEGRLIEAFHYRYHPAFETCLDWVRSGEIGAIERIQARFDVSIPDNGTEIRHRPARGGGAFMDLGCYPLNWTLTVMDAAPVQISANAKLTPAGVDASLSALLTFDGGAVADLSSSMVEGTPFEASLRITGENGTITFDNPLAPHQGAKLVMQTVRGQRIARINRISTYTHQLATIAQQLGTGATLPTEGAILLRQQSALDAIYSAAGLAHLRETGVGSS